MQNKLVKAEILITRKCPLDCFGCRMIRTSESEYHPQVGSELNKKGWRKVIDGLNRVGCPFFAIYGSEPLSVFETLYDFVYYAEKKKGILTTVITSGIGLTEDKLHKLHKAGLRSLTVSIDNLDPKAIEDKATSTKAKTGAKWINYWKKNFPDQRDAEVCVTVTRRNIQHLPDLIKYYSEKGIWVHFDIIHYSRGQEGTKVSDIEYMRDDYFRTQDHGMIVEVMDKVLKLKEDGALIHPSQMAIIKWREIGSTVYLNWQCSWPGFVTIDCNGVVRNGCDDFHVKQNEIYAWEFPTRFEEFVAQQKRLVREHSCHCFWATHYDAELIHNGHLDHDHYVHHQVEDRK